MGRAKARALCAEDGFIAQALRRDRSISVFASSADFLADDNVLAAIALLRPLAWRTEDARRVRASRMYHSAPNVGRV
jgi:hypothetical protein